jgi:DNA-binding CsgD family transcriptional regulator
VSLLADLFSRSTDGVFAVDAKERIVFWNEACENQLGIPRQEALGRACYDVVHACTLSGQPFCKPGCCVARLAEGGSPPPAFPLRFGNGRGKSTKFSVHTALVPSPRRDLWTVVHLLHRGETADMGESLEQSNGQQPRIPEGRHNRNETLPPSPVDSLTARERGILRLLAAGHASSVISRQLCISPVTVRNHIQHLIGKLGLHSQLEAVAYAYRHKLI